MSSVSACRNVWTALVLPRSVVQPASFRRMSSMFLKACSNIGQIVPDVQPAVAAILPARSHRKKVFSDSPAPDGYPSLWR